MILDILKNSKTFKFENLSSKNIVSILNKELSSNEISTKKTKFESILGKEIEYDIFCNILFNSIYCPYINTVSNINTNYIHDLYLESKGRLPKACQQLYKKNTHNYFNNLKAKKISNEINKNGFAVLPEYFDKNFIRNIKNELLNFEYRATADFNYKDKLKNLKKKDTKYSVFFSNLKTKKINNQMAIYKILSDIFFRDIAGCYFQSDPYVVSAGVVYTKIKDPKSFTQQEIHQSAQKYHFDQAHLKFLKIFVYLNDIYEPSEGSHNYIQSTHEENFSYPDKEIFFEKAGLKKTINGKYSGLVKDEWINDNFEKERIKDFCYPEGTVIIENTTGLHKGNHCTTKDRDLFSFIYSLSAISPMKTERIVTLDSEIYKDKYNNFDFLYPLSEEIQKYQLHIGNDFYTNKKNKILNKLQTLLNRLKKYN